MEVTPQQAVETVDWHCLSERLRDEVERQGHHISPSMTPLPLRHERRLAHEHDRPFVSFASEDGRTYFKLSDLSKEKSSTGKIKFRDDQRKIMDEHWTKITISIDIFDLPSIQVQRAGDTRLKVGQKIAALFDKWDEEIVKKTKDRYNPAGLHKSGRNVKDLYLIGLAPLDHGGRMYSCIVGLPSDAPAKATIAGDGANEPVLPEGPSPGDPSCDSTAGSPNSCRSAAPISPPSYAQHSPFRGTYDPSGYAFSSAPPGSTAAARVRQLQAHYNTTYLGTYQAASPEYLSPTRENRGYSGASIDILPHLASTSADEEANSSCASRAQSISPTASTVSHDWSRAPPSMQGAGSINWNSNSGLRGHYTEPPRDASHHHSRARQTWSWQGSSSNTTKSGMYTGMEDYKQ